MAVDGQDAVAEAGLTETILLVGRAMVGIATRSLDEATQDLTLPQYRVLVLLTFRGDSSLKALAEAVGASPSTATRMCDRLVKKALISRDRHHFDRREVVLSVTPTGRQIVETVMERRRGIVQDLLHTIPNAERPGLLQSLRMLSVAAGETPPETPWSQGWIPKAEQG
jgi:DNA-binding MarR family transcriptional regulator